ncbi:MAG: hypothetical protein IJ562_12290 [Prevotella sp.]|nr:hypothetical protein [Prevotella sp.]
MKKTLIFAYSVAMMIIAGCTQETYEQENATLPQDNQITLTVSAVAKNAKLNGSVETRVAYGSEDATWEEGDKIFLIKGDGTTITLTLSDGAGTSTGSFSSTDPVVAGTYIPYAVSASSLTKGYVSVSEGVITLNLTSPGGGSLADALEHDILKGDALELTDNQTSTTITGLTTHLLSYMRFKFISESKAITSVGMNSAGGVYRIVTIASNGTISRSDASTDVVSVSASDDGAGNYTGYFAVYGSTSTSLVAHAEDADGGKYSRLVSTKNAEYAAGNVYGKSFILTDAMVNAEATGTLSDHHWKNLGLSVKWAEYNVGSTNKDELDYTYSEYGSAVPSGWRKPTKAELSELFYASSKTWLSVTRNAVKFSCNGNDITIGAGGIYYWWDNNAYSYGDRIYNEGLNVNIWLADNEYDDSNINTQGTVLAFSNSPYYYNSRNGARNGYRAALRLVCDY